MKVGPIACCLQVDKTRAQSKEMGLHFKMLEGCETLPDRQRNSHPSKLQAKHKWSLSLILAAEVGHGVKI